jgi:DNA-binding XRE family transcriptional regulator
MVTETELAPEALEGYEILRDPDSDEPEWVILPLTVWQRVPRRGRTTAKLRGVQTSDELGVAFLPWSGFLMVYDAIEDAVDEELAGKARAVMAREAAARRREEARRGAPVAKGVPADVVSAELAGTHPVAAWRKHRGLTQLELAGAAGIDRAYLANLERGAKSGSAETLAKIARALGCLVEDLIPAE